MKKWWEKIKQHPIYSNVAAGLIKAAILGIIGIIVSIIYFQTILEILGQKWIVPMWGLVIIGIIPIICVVIFYFLYNSLEYIPEYGIYKHKRKQLYFCPSNKHPLHEFEHSWYCHTCKQRFDKENRQPKKARVISPGIENDWFGRGR